MTYRVLYERTATGGWTARVPVILGCRTVGLSLDDVRMRIRELILLNRPMTSFELDEDFDHAYAVPTAHMRCPACGQEGDADIEPRTDDLIVFYCGACGNRWSPSETTGAVGPAPPR